MPAVAMSWMQKITNVHFGGGVPYLVVTITATQQVNGTDSNPNPGPPSPAGLSVDGSTLSSEKTITTKTTPSKPIAQKFFFAWINNAPFPSLTTFDTPFNVGGITFEYMGQFGVTHNFNAQGFVLSSPPGANPNTGLYANLAAAQKGAAFLNALLAANSSSNGGAVIEWFNPDRTIGGPSLATQFVGFEFDVPGVQPGFATTTVTQTFLVPLKQNGPFDITATAVNTDGNLAQVAVTASLSINQPDNIKSISQVGSPSIGTVGGGARGGEITGVATDDINTSSIDIIPINFGFGGPAV